MNHNLKVFFDKSRKLRNGHVPDVLEMSTEQKDMAVIAALRDIGSYEVSGAYMAFSEPRKNSVYQSVEWIIRDAIDSYNRGVDVENEAFPKLTSCEAFL